jgi:hypothetical protein
MALSGRPFGWDTVDMWDHRAGSVIRTDVRRICCGEEPHPQRSSAGTNIQSDQRQSVPHLVGDLR